VDQYVRLKIQRENSKPVEKPGHKVTGLSGTCRMIAGLPMLGYIETIQASEQLALRGVFINYAYKEAHRG
jgi:hypothetical protein